MWIQRLHRSKEAGKQIHAQNLAEQERVSRERAGEAEFIEIDNPESAEGVEGVVDAKIVGFEPLSSDDPRTKESLEDFGIQPK
jgi:hypothetical protein